MMQMGVYTAIPAAYALASIVVFILLVEMDWFGGAFLTFGPTINGTEPGLLVKSFCGQPIRSMRQYRGLLAISCVNALLSTFYNELMRPFWFNVVNPNHATRHATLNSEMKGSLARLFKANVEAEIYLKFAHVLTLFLSLVDAWIILAQLCGSTVGSTAVLLWHWKIKRPKTTTADSRLIAPDDMNPR